MRIFARVQRRRAALPVRGAAAPSRFAARADHGLRGLLRAPALAPPAHLVAPPVLERGTAAAPAVTQAAKAAPSPVVPLKETEKPKVVAPPSPAPEAPEKTQKPDKPERPEKTVAALAEKADKPAKPATVPAVAEKVDKPAKAAAPAVAGKADKPEKAAAVPAAAERPRAAAGAPKLEAAQRSATQTGTTPSAVSKAPTPPAHAKPESRPGAAEPHAEKKQPGGPSAKPAKVAGLEELKEQVRKEARKQRKHPKPRLKRDEATAATALPKPDQDEQSSKEKSQRAMGQVAADQQARQEDNARNNAAAFKKAFQDLVKGQKAPQSEGEVKAYAEKPPVEKSTEAIESDVAKKQTQMVEPLQKQLDKLPEPDEAKKARDVPPAPVAPAPAPPDAKLAAPQPRAGVEAEMQRHSDSLDGAMEKNRLSDDQLAESREPSFLETLEAKRQAQQKIAEAPDAYRKREQEILHGTEAKAGESLGTGLQGMAAVNQKTGGRVHGGQGATEKKTETRQGEIKKTIDGIHQKTVEKVGDLLKNMATEVRADFTTRLKGQSDTFNKNVRARISEYYGNWRIDDKLFGPAPVIVNDKGDTRPITFDEALGRKKITDGKPINPDVYRIFNDEKKAFLEGMDVELDHIARSVEAKLSEAALAISDGEAEVERFKKTLSGEELKYAEELEADVKMKFDILRGSIDDAREDLLQALADEYNQAANQLEVSFNEINDELKKSWLDRAIEFIETVGKTIFQLAELLFSILSRLAHLIWKIIKHPIRFFETLVSGLGQGISMFVKNFATYLQEAFWTWITGASPARNIRLSVGSGIESLFDLVLQVLDLGREGLRAIVEKVFGKKFTQGLDKVLEIADKAIEPLTILLTKGPLALWEHLREQLGTLVQSTFERIKESVFFAFVEKGLKWIAGFFVPGGGFVKVVKAIVAAFQFVAENLERLRVFFDSVFDSMEAAVEGRTEGVANKIIAGLKMGIVLALDFLAKQLGLGNIVDQVHKVFQSLRRPIVAAIEWLLRKIKPFVMKVVNKAVAAGKKVVAVGKKAVARLRNWWRAREPFTSEAGERHTLYLEGSETGARLMIQSETQSYQDFVKGVAPPGEEPARKEARGIAKDLDKAVARAAGRGKAPGGAPSLDEDPSAQIQRLLQQLADVTAKFIPARGDESSEAVYGPLVHGFGSSVRIARLTKKHLAGSQPSVQGGHWEALRRRQFGGGSYYVRGHLLNHNLGGPGAAWSNLTPLTQAANNRAVDSMLHEFETPVKKKVDAGGRVDFKVSASYNWTHPMARQVAKLEASRFEDDRVIAEIVRAEKHIPDTLECEAYEVLVSGERREKVAKHTVRNTIEATSKTDYQLTAKPIEPFYISEKSVVELQKLDGVTPRIAAAIVKNKPEDGYRTVAQLHDASGIDWESAEKTKGFDVHLYRRP